MKTFLLAIAVVALSSCAPTTGTNREYDIPVTVSSNTGTVNITLEMKVDAASLTDQDANPVISPSTRLQLTEGGSVAGADGANMADIAAKWLADQSKKNSENSTTSTSTTNNVAGDQTVKDEEAGSIPEVATGVEIPVDPAMVFNKEETFNMYNVGDGGRHAWRIQKKGIDFGKTIKLTFASGYEAVIPDTSVRFALKNGLIYRPGTGEKVKPIVTNIQTSHGGMYLYAPSGDKSTWVKISY